MPLYEYQCDKCGERFDSIRTMDARKVAPCPHCEHGMGQQRITPVAIDYYNMGLDPRGNPTAADKWAKMHEQKGSQRSRDNVT